MIILNTTFRTMQSKGSYRKGYVNFPSEISEELGWKEQPVILIIAKPGENINMEKLSQKLGEYEKLCMIEEELQKLKEEIEFDIKQTDTS